MISLGGEFGSRSTRVREVRADADRFPKFSEARNWWGMLSADSSPLPEGGIGAMVGGWLEDMAGLCTTGLSASVAVERGEAKEESPLLPSVCDGAFYGFISEYCKALFYTPLHVSATSTMPLDRRSFKSPPAALTSTRASQAARRAQVRSKNSPESVAEEMTEESSKGFGRSETRQ